MAVLGIVPNLGTVLTSKAPDLGFDLVVIKDAIDGVSGPSGIQDNPIAQQRIVGKVKQNA